MQAKSLIQTRNFTFPSSHEDIEVITYKNPDGSFKNCESVVQGLKRAFLDINDAILSFIEPEPTNFYTLRLITATKARVLEFRPLSGSTRMDYETETVKHELSSDQLDHVKGLVISSITDFLELFSFYYHAKKEADARAPETVNNDLIPLLRFSNGARIKFLEELLSLYLTMNGQTYFDVVSHIVMSGAYTFGSLFSTTGLYYAAHSKLTGKIMLHGASRRAFADNSDSKEKGEIHTLQGLTILHLRQFRLRQRRTMKTRPDTTYESIPIVEDDTSAEIKVSSPSNESSKKRVFEKVKNFKLLTETGFEHLPQMQDDLVTLMNEPECLNVIPKLKQGSLGSMIHILQTFDNPIFEDLLHKLDEHINHNNDHMIQKQVLAIDMFGLSKNRDLVNRNMIRFLALLESTPSESDLTDSIVQKFNNTTEPTDVVLQYVGDFLELIS